MAQAVLCIASDAFCLETRGMLLEHFGFEVLKTTSIEQGMELLHSHPVRAVVVDEDIAEQSHMIDTLAHENNKVPVVLLARDAWHPAHVPGSSSVISSSNNPSHLLLSLSRAINVQHERHTHRARRVLALAAASLAIGFLTFRQFLRRRQKDAA